MATTRDEIFKKVQGVLVDALGVDDEEVTAGATLRGDLGAESIDILDILFRLEKAFTTDPATPFKIPRNEMFPEDIFKNTAFVQNGKMTPAGLTELEKRMPYMDLTAFKADPNVEKLPLTVGTIVNYMAMKLGAK